MNGNSRVKRRKGATRFAFNRHVYNPPCSPSPSYSRYLHLFALCSSEITRGMKLSQFVSNYKFHLSLNSFRQQFSTPALSGEAEKRKNGESIKQLTMRSDMQMRRDSTIEKIKESASVSSTLDESYIFSRRRSMAHRKYSHTYSHKEQEDRILVARGMISHAHT